MNPGMTLERRTPLSVAAYCRVSTDSADQANSFENQKSYFEKCICAHENWQLFRIYADAGITGTSTAKRAAFCQMMKDAEAHAFDLILTKEVSRFARNTLDALRCTRMLKEWNIGVMFLLDNIYTLDADAELRLTIMASLAQEESRKTSERVKWGQRRQMEKGVVFGRDLLGYRVSDGKIEVEPNGAETVRLIFHKFTAENKSVSAIARELSASGIPTFTGKTEWRHGTVLKILQNEKYCGDLVQKKTYTPNYLTHEKRQNHGNEPFVCQTSHHEPLVPRRVWNAANERLCERKEKKVPGGSVRYPLSGKILCGFCGKPFAARTKAQKSGACPSWQCRNPACTAKHVQIRGKDFALVTQRAFEALEIDKAALWTAVRRRGGKAFIPKAAALLENIAENDRFYRQVVAAITVYGREKMTVRFTFADAECTVYLD